MGDINTYFLVLAGFTLKTYTDINYITPSCKFNNINGSLHQYYNSSPLDTISSVKLYYNGVEILDTTINYINVLSVWTVPSPQVSVFNNATETIPLTSTHPSEPFSYSINPTYDVSPFPGAYIFNTSFGLTPIFTTFDLSLCLKADKDNYWIVMPNYKLVVTNTSVQSYNINNINGNKILYVPSTLIGGIDKINIVYLIYQNPAIGIPYKIGFPINSILNIANYIIPYTYYPPLSTFKKLSPYPLSYLITTSGSYPIFGLTYSTFLTYTSLGMNSNDKYWLTLFGYTIVTNTTYAYGMDSGNNNQLFLATSYIANSATQTTMLRSKSVGIDIQNTSTFVEPFIIRGDVEYTRIFDDVNNIFTITVTKTTGSCTIIFYLTSVNILVVGGGGGGAGGLSYDSTGGGGGGAGGIGVYNNCPVGNGNSFTIVVGAGGLGGGNNVNGSPGVTTISGLLTATGGGGGISSTGVGGTNGTSTVATLIYTGGNGGHGSDNVNGNSSPGLNAQIIPVVVGGLSYSVGGGGGGGSGGGVVKGGKSGNLGVGGLAKQNTNGNGENGSSESYGSGAGGATTGYVGGTGSTGVIIFTFSYSPPV